MVNNFQHLTEEMMTGVVQWLRTDQRSAFSAEVSFCKDKHIVTVVVK
jgi:hypothetical protein